jgi:hypothetical protein
MHVSGVRVRCRHSRVTRGERVHLAASLIQHTKRQRRVVVCYRISQNKTLSVLQKQYVTYSTAHCEEYIRRLAKNKTFVLVLDVNILLLKWELNHDDDGDDALRNDLKLTKSDLETQHGILLRSQLTLGKTEH